MLTKEGVRDHSMRAKIKDIRRKELLQATLETIHKTGLHNITVAKLSEVAGMSQGMVHHYFKNKAEVIEAAIRYLNAELRDEVVMELRKASTPCEKLFKIIDVNFAPHWFNQNVTRLWVSFCGEVPFNPVFFRIQRVIHRRMQSNLKHALQDILGKSLAASVSYELSNMIDGLWLRAAVSEDVLDPEQAVHSIETYLKRLGIDRP
ncbi:MAG: transcriptional regulator BetI [Marinomonas foliarum]|uniref:transcriptional regulator BetI n=1 Tax=Marinomonas foliarum TaxID=491950 RepID=UPI003F9A883D